MQELKDIHLGEDSRVRILQSSHLEHIQNLDKESSHFVSST